MADKNSMNVLHITHDYYGSKVYRELIGRLNEYENNIIAVPLEKTFDKDQVVNSDNVLNIFEVEQTRFGVMKIAKRIYRSIKESIDLHSIDILHAHFVRDGFGKKKIREIKYSDVLFFYNYLIDERGLKVATLDNVHTTLHPAFDMAVRDNLIRLNPTDGVMAAIKKTPGRVKGVRHALTKEQQKHFLEYVEECPLLNKWLPLFTILLGTGMRIGEAIGLRWEDVDFDRHMISINHNLVYYTHDYERERLSKKQISLPKTAAGVRVIPMMPQVFDAFMYLYEYQRRKRIQSLFLRKH